MVITTLVINQYGQGLISADPILKEFELLGLTEKATFFNWMLFLIQQSKPQVEDIEPAIIESGLKPTFTPCVLLRKGVETYHLRKIVGLPEMESQKVFLLLMALFKKAYERRFIAEKNDPHKWWYWDLSDQEKLKEVLKRQTREI